MASNMKHLGLWVSLVVTLALAQAGAQMAAGNAVQSAASGPAPHEGDFVIHNFRFQSGETMADVKMHYTTFGTPMKDASGRTTNAVLILHGTSGSGQQFLRPIFAGVLFGPGQLLDASKFYIILPDNVGHGKSSKPSDGMHARFPPYDYADMVALQHELVEKGLGVNHLRLVLGTSMGCMHSFMWGEAYPDEMDALMPLACLPVQIAGRNRIWRKMVIDGIRQDPDWKNGEYTSEPRAALRISADFLLIAGSAPLLMQHDLPTRDDADKYLDGALKKMTAEMDATDFLYAVSASRDYDPSAQLSAIKAPVMFVNTADDFINPPELGIAEREIKKVKNGKFVLLPASEKTHGHGTHSWAAVWQEYLKELLEESSPARP
ncbi:MAG TPA: alpha/beta fold hydrolase [Terriglobales bacterium]|nr:alpha/beta fold hydrolase [Terriglobales bacterium]